MAVYYQNVRGLRTKCKVFSTNLNLNYYDIIGITETWLNDSVFNGELFNDQYVVFRRDRSTSASPKIDGGGSLLAINKNYTSHCTRRLEWESLAEDCLDNIICT